MPAPVIASIEACLSPDTGVRLAVLYGSHARATATAASDVDLGIAMRAPMSLDTRLALNGRLVDALGREVDLIDLSTVNGTVLVSVHDPVSISGGYSRQRRRSREQSRA